MAAAGRNCPLAAPHEALRPALTCQMDGQQPPEQAGTILGVFKGVHGPQSAPLFRQCTSPQHPSVLRAIHTLNTQKITSACSRSCCPSIWCIGMGRKALYGALGAHFCWWRPWLDMVVLVVVSCWRLTSDQTTVGIVKMSMEVFFLFLCRSNTFLTSDPAAKNGRHRPLHFAL